MDVVGARIAQALFHSLIACEKKRAIIVAHHREALPTQRPLVLRALGIETTSRLRGLCLVNTSRPTTKSCEQLREGRSADARTVRRLGRVLRHARGDEIDVLRASVPLGVGLVAARPAVVFVTVFQDAQLAERSRGRQDAAAMDSTRARAEDIVFRGKGLVAAIEAAGGPTDEDRDRYKHHKAKVERLESALVAEASGELGFLPIIWLAGAVAAAAFALPILYRIQQRAEDTIDTVGSVTSAALWGTALFFGYRMLTTGRLPFTKRTI